MALGQPVKYLDTAGVYQDAGDAHPLPVADQASGSVSDPAATSGDGDATEIALLKGLVDAAYATDPVPTYEVGVANNGTVVERYIGAANTDGHVPKVGATTAWVTGFNAESFPLFIKLYDQATTPNSGDTPKITIGVGAGQPVPPMPDIGLPFLNGLAYRVTKLIADNDATNPTAGNSAFNIIYVP